MRLTTEDTTPARQRPWSAAATGAAGRRIRSEGSVDAGHRRGQSRLHGRGVRGSTRAAAVAPASDGDDGSAGVRSGRPQRARARAILASGSLPAAAPDGTAAVCEQRRVAAGAGAMPSPSQWWPAIVRRRTRTGPDRTDRSHGILATLERHRPGVYCCGRSRQLPVAGHRPDRPHQSRVGSSLKHGGHLVRFWSGSRPQFRLTAASGRVRLGAAGRPGRPPACPPVRRHRRAAGVVRVRRSNACSAYANADDAGRQACVRTFGRSMSAR